MSGSRSVGALGVCRQAWTLLLASACVAGVMACDDAGGTEPLPSAPADTATGEDASGQDAKSDVASDPGPADAPGPDLTDGATDTVDASNPAATAACEAWAAARADVSEGAWTGSASTCSAGTVGSPGRENALRLVNAYRALAGLAPVDTDPALDGASQACALLMEANDMMSHDPPASWSCWSQAAADAAAASLISPTAGVFAIDHYMVDPANESTLTHRRWLLSNDLGDIGLGSTDRYSCLHVISTAPPVDRREWTAWPPPGAFPFRAASTPWNDLDETGWSIQSDDLDLHGASVAVSVGGSDRPVEVWDLLERFGSATAVAFRAQGWELEPGVTYDVEVTGAGLSPIRYSVDVVACP